MNAPNEIYLSRAPQVRLLLSTTSGKEICHLDYEIHGSKLVRVEGEVPVALVAEDAYRVNLEFVSVDSPTSIDGKVTLEL